MLVGESEWVRVDADDGDSSRLIGGTAGVNEDDEDEDMAEVDATGSALLADCCACPLGL